MIFFVYNFARKCQSHWRKNFLPHVRYVATIPCESVRHKSNTFHTILALCAFTETSIDETNKRQQKVRNSKFMFKMSTIHANTCIQTTSTCYLDHIYGNQYRWNKQNTAESQRLKIYVQNVHHGSNITNVWQNFFTPMTLAFSCEVVHEKLWKSVNICKSYSKKNQWHFFSGHGVD